MHSEMYVREWLDLKTQYEHLREPIGLGQAALDGLEALANVGEHHQPPLGHREDDADGDHPDDDQPDDDRHHRAEVDLVCVDANKQLVQLPRSVSSGL